MRTPTCVPDSEPDSILPSLPYVNQELQRARRSTKIRLNQLGLDEDLKQELHLAFYETASAEEFRPDRVKRALHAACERLRYREIARRAKYEVPEEFAGRAYHQLMYGAEPTDGSTSD